jgi:hypothetical protein
MIKGKEVVSVLDGLAKTSTGWTVIESKLNPTTELRPGQAELLEHIKAGGTFTIVADVEKNAVLQNLLKVSSGTEIAATQYLVIHQGNAGQMLGELKAIGPDDIATIGKGGTLITLTRDEAAAAYALASQRQGMLWADAAKLVKLGKTVAPGLAVAAIAGIAMLGKSAQAAEMPSGEQQSQTEVGQDASALEWAGLTALGVGGLFGAAGRLLGSKPLAGAGGSLIKYGGLLTAPMTLHAAQEDIRSDNPIRMLAGGLSALSVVPGPIGIAAAAGSAEVRGMGWFLEQLAEGVVVAFSRQGVPFGVGR